MPNRENNDWDPGNNWWNPDGNKRLGYPWGDIEHPLPPPECTAGFGMGRARGYAEAWFERLVGTIIEATATAPCCICPEWLLAILWDEIARRKRNPSTGADEERQSDDEEWWPSVGPFQITLATARDAMRWGGEFSNEERNLNDKELHDRLTNDAGFAARVATARLCQILAGYLNKGYNPCAEGSISVIELVGSLYSQGLGRPKANPKVNERGRQIADFAEKIKRRYDMPDCNVCENGKLKDKCLPKPR